MNNNDVIVKRASREKCMDGEEVRKRSVKNEMLSRTGILEVDYALTSQQTGKHEGHMSTKEGEVGGWRSMWRFLELDMHIQCLGLDPPYKYRCKVKKKEDHFIFLWKNV